MKCRQYRAYGRVVDHARRAAACVIAKATAVLKQTARRCDGRIGEVEAAVVDAGASGPGEFRWTSLAFWVVEREISRRGEVGVAGKFEKAGC